MSLVLKCDVRARIRTAVEVELFHLLMHVEIAWH